MHGLHLAVDDQNVEGAAVVTDMQVISADKDASFDTVNIVVSEFVTTLEERVITTSFEVCVLPIKDLPEIFVPSENKNVTTHENEAVAIVGTTLLGVDDFAIERATEYRLDVISPLEMCI